MLFIAVMILSCLSVLAAIAAPVFASTYNLAIINGTVIDPETHLFAPRNIGIIGNKIVKITSTSEMPDADQTIDAAGLVVSPGFIDQHTHAITPLSQEYQIFDGVTTSLETEIGYYPVSKIGDRVKNAPLIHYGATVGYLNVKLWVKNGIKMPVTYGSPMPVSPMFAATAYSLLMNGFEMGHAADNTLLKQATDFELKHIRKMLVESLDGGALGIGLALDYMREGMPANGKEMKMLFQLAGERKAPVYVHIRRGYPGNPGPEGNMAYLNEILNMAQRYNAPVNIAHVSHSAISDIGIFLTRINEFKAHGLDVTAEVMPFEAGSTAIEAACFGRNWQAEFNITYSNIQRALDGVWYDQQLFNNDRTRHPKYLVMHHYLTEAMTRDALQDPGIIVVTDMVMNSYENEKTGVPPFHGAFSRVLGKFVREDNALTLQAAIRAMTLNPANRLGSYVPAFKRKGRIQIGMDADITIFDPNTIECKANFQNPDNSSIGPWHKSEGVKHVVVDGKVVMNNRVLQNVYPGKMILRKKYK